MQIARVIGTVVVTRKDGSVYHTEFFECCTCTTMFRNPKYFGDERGFRALSVQVPPEKDA